MSELRIFYRDGNRIKIAKTLDVLKEVSMKELLWIYLNDLTVELVREL